MALSKWNNVNFTGGNAGTSAMMGAGNLFNKAISTAQDGMTKHEERLKENALKQADANTAELYKMAKEGKNLTKEDFEKMGTYNGSAFNKQIMELDKFNQQKIKDSAQIKNWEAEAEARKMKANAESTKPSYLQKKLIDAKLAMSKEAAYKDNKYGSYYDKSKSKFAGSEAGKLMEEVGLRPETVNNKGETDYGSIDMDNSLVYQTAINKAIASGVDKKTLRRAMSRNTSTGSFMSGLTGEDEMQFNVDGFLRDAGL